MFGSLKLMGFHNDRSGLVQPEPEVCVHVELHNQHNLDHNGKLREPELWTPPFSKSWVPFSWRRTTPPWSPSRDVCQDVIRFQLAMHRHKIPRWRFSVHTLLFHQLGVEELLNRLCTSPSWLKLCQIDFADPAGENHPKRNFSESVHRNIVWIGVTIWHRNAPGIRCWFRLVCHGHPIFLQKKLTISFKLERHFNLEDLGWWKGLVNRVFDSVSGISIPIG
jgi:hypothetical protein